MTTENLVIAAFDHDLTRDNDPGLHSHYVTMNLTQRPDGEWRALTIRPLLERLRLAGAIYRARLAQELQALGYDTRDTGLDGTFELANVSDAAVREFSQRTRGLEDYLRTHHGIKDPKSATPAQKKAAALATRDAKSDVDRVALLKDWGERATAVNLDLDPTAHVAAPTEKITAEQAVGRAIAHLAERRQVFSAIDLLRFGTEAAVGSTGFAEVEAAVQASVASGASGALIRSGDLFTTPQAQQREREILRMEELGRDAVPPIVSSEGGAAVTARLLCLGNEGQQLAASHLLTTCNQVSAIVGRAGVGKTTLLEIATRLAREHGYSLVALAPSTGATQLLDEGLHSVDKDAAINSRTVAAFLHRSPAMDSKTLIVVDEASMVSAMQMHGILTTAREAGARVVLVGDDRQLESVEAGSSFSQLLDHGISRVVVDEIIRQRDAPELKAAVEHASEGRAAASLGLLKKTTHEIAKDADRHSRIAEDFAALTPHERRETAVIAGTRAARDAINQEIRARVIAPEAKRCTVSLLDPRDLTNAHARFARAYQVGDLLIPDRDYRTLGLKRGEHARVVGHDDLGRVMLRCDPDDGHVAHWAPGAVAEGKSPMRVQAYRVVEREIAAGDVLRAISNDRRTARTCLQQQFPDEDTGELHARLALDEDGEVVPLVNGERLVVREISESAIFVTREDGQLVGLPTSKPLALDYGYCSTIHASQGKTVDRVLIDADTKSLTSNQRTFYVAVSRAKTTAAIYTDDAAELPEAMGRIANRGHALDVVPDGAQPHPRTEAGMEMAA